MRPLYLDTAATTPIRKEVLDEMISSLNDFGNSEARYYSFSENAKKNIQVARERIATALGCNSDEVIFTSGATEANNLFIKGYAEANPHKKKIIISKIEHSSVRETCYYLKKYGYNVVEIPVDSSGLINMDILKKEINEQTLFVSIIAVNNEIGTIQNLKEIDAVCYENNVPFHSDATQAIGKIDIKLNEYKALNFLTFSSHKIYGPKGIGALIVKKANGIKVDLAPLFHGGEQEEGYRAGTLSNELIVGFGKATELITNCIQRNNDILANLEKTLLQKLKNKFGDYIKVNNAFSNRVYGLINLQFIGQNNMILLKQMSPIVAASTGSACSISKPSNVLAAIGLNSKEISYSIRLSLSIFNTPDDLKIIDNL